MSDFSPSGQTGVMWVLATADTALTTDEIVERMDTSRHATVSAVRRCYDKGYVTRGTRVQPHQEGVHPYEYRINDRS